ncbi:hypothetical protein CRM90_16245 [Mycobacterium sp. ENV421]|nr:hypothetical protein CRM90_16245 [Mycobacterium sp. ENV421]
MLAAAVGLGLAVSVGNGVAAASTDGGSDSGNSSASNSGSNSGHSTNSTRGPKNAGPARTRSTAKQPTKSDSNSGSSVSVRSSTTGRIPSADSTVESSTSTISQSESSTSTISQSESSTSTISQSESSTSTISQSESSTSTISQSESSTSTISQPESSTSTLSSTDTVTTPATAVDTATVAPTEAPPATATTSKAGAVSKSTTARSAVAPSAAAYSMNGDLTAVQDGAGPITTPAHYDIQTTLDAWAAQLDALVAAPLTGANGWLKFPVTFLDAFFKPSIVVDRLSYGLNGLATLIDQFVPPFKMVDGAPSAITEASVTAAVLAGAIVLFNTSQTVDIPHWIDEAISLAGALQDIAANPVVNGLTANDMDGVVGAARAAFLSPKTVLDMTIDLGKAPNPVSLAMYVVVVAIFRRFADVATDHAPVVTDMRQTSQHLPGASGTTVSGYVQFYDADGDPITSYGFTEPDDSRFTVTVVDGTNGRMNWTVWDWNPLGPTTPKTLTFTLTVLAQGDGQISVSKPYMPNGDETVKTVTVTVYYNQAVGTMTNTVSSTSSLGVVRGSISTPQNADNPTTFALNGASGGSAYTANGGIVKLNAATGAYTYIPNRASTATTDSFQVVSTDSFGYSYTTSVSVPVSSVSPVTTFNTRTGTVTGNLDIPAGSADSGLMTYTLGTAPNSARGTVTVNADGTFVYTRSATAGSQPTTDSFTILGTDSSGKTVTVAVVNVNATTGNSAPVGNGVTVGSSKLERIVGPYDKQTTTGTLKATDADGDPVTWAAGTYSTAQGGSITVAANGTFTYTNQKYAWFGVSDSYWHDHAVTGDPGDTFTVNVSDGFGGTTAVTYGIPIEKQNATPTLSGTVNGTPTVDILGVRRGSINTGSDDDGDSLTYGLVGATLGSAYTANGGIVTMNGTSFTYIPKVGVTSDSFQVQVNDGHGGITTATVSLTGLTTPGTTTNINKATLGTETGTLNIPSPSDTTTLGLAYSVGTGPSKGTVTLTNTGGTYTYTYVRNSSLGHSTSNVDSFTINATDASGKTVTVATISVAPDVANTVPVISTATTDKGSTDSNKWRLDTLAGNNRQQTTTGKITATDADGDTLTYSLVDGTTHAAVTTTTNGGSVTFNADGSYTYTIVKDKSYFHAAAKVGASGAAVNDTFTVAVSDSLGGVAYTTVTMATYAVNSAPTFVSSSGVTNVFGLKTVSGIKFSDADGDTIGTTRNPSNGSAGYFAPSGFTGGTDNVQSGTGALVTFTGTYTLYVQDGYYTVSNGVITGSYAVSTPTKSWS